MAYRTGQQLKKMKSIELQQLQHSVKVGDACGEIAPNVTEDCIFTIDGKPIGFYINSVQGKLRQLVEVANAELLSDRVPKSEMRRSSGLRNKETEVRQFSTIIGSCPPKPHMRRPYPTISSVHQVKTAQTFVKAMLMACHEAEQVSKKSRQKSTIPRSASLRKKYRLNGDSGICLPVRSQIST